MAPESIHRRKSRTVSTFLKKTYEILDDSENWCTVRWAHDGVGFVVLNQEQFSSKILPKYFKHSNYSSFVRQLNMYNFHKIREANHESHFHHQNFRINNKELLSEIRRKPERKKKKNEESDDENKQKQEISIIGRMEEQQMRGRQVGKEESMMMILSWKQISKKGLENTRSVFSSQRGQIMDSLESPNTPRSKENIQDDDDKISINNQLAEMFPKCPNKQIFYPSNPHIHPLPFGAPISNFSLFF